jgi:hypothetical protein
MSMNRYTLLSIEPEDSSSQPSQSKVRGIGAVSGSQCGSMTFGHGKVTPKAGSCGWMLNFLLKFSHYCTYHQEEMKGPYQQILKALRLLHEEGIPWAEEANDEVSWWTLGIPDPNDKSNEVL